MSLKKFTSKVFSLHDAFQQCHFLVRFPYSGFVGSWIPSWATRGHKISLSSFDFQAFLSHLLMVPGEELPPITGLLQLLHLQISAFTATHALPCAALVAVLEVVIS